MMMRNNNNEWDAFVAKYKAEHNYTGTIEYDYTVNPEILQVYWREAVEIYKDYEVQYSLGMRGKHDVPFSTKTSTMHHGMVIEGHYLNKSLRIKDKS